jgi:hypothetical protein
MCLMLGIKKEFTNTFPVYWLWIIAQESLAESVHHERFKSYEGYSKIKFRLTGKKNQNREQNFIIWNSYIPH